MEPNKTLIYKAETLYLPVPGEHLTVEDRPFDPAAAPPTGGLIVKNLFLSLDPSHRGQMYKPYEAYSYAVPWVLGQPARVTTLGSVIQSDNAGFKPGDLILAFTVGAAAEYTTIAADQLPMVQVLALPEGVPPELLPPSRILVSWPPPSPLPPSPNTNLSRVLLTFRIERPRGPGPVSI